jgi:hypothetical protein
MANELIERIKAIGPYVALEVVMPGGTLLALLLFWYRRKLGMVVPLDEANTPAMTSATPQGTVLAANP